MAKQENLLPTETGVLTFATPRLKAFHEAGHFKPATKRDAQRKTQTLGVHKLP